MNNKPTDLLDANARLREENSHLRQEVKRLNAMADEMISLLYD